MEEKVILETMGIPMFTRELGTLFLGIAGHGGKPVCFSRRN